MNSKTAKKLLTKARSLKKVKRGDTIASLEYDRLKKEHKMKGKSQQPKFKLSKRQQRVASFKKISDVPTSVRQAMMRQEKNNNKPKQKGHRL